jgi:glutamate dehydrogenase
MINRVGSTFVHRLSETTGARASEIVRAYLLSREVFGLVPLWMAIEALDNKVDDEVQSTMLIDTSRQLERGTVWFLRSRRLADDMGATISRFTPGVAELAQRLPKLLDAGERTRVDAAVAAYVARGVPPELAMRVVTFDTLYASLDIAEVAADSKRPVELVAAIYFELAHRLGLPWLREHIAAVPGDQHWQMLAKGAMQDDLSSLQRTLTSDILASSNGIGPSALIGGWQDSNRRAFDRALRMLAELRSAAAPDAAMLAVALRELRNLG